MKLYVLNFNNEDDKVCIPSLSSILLAVMFASSMQLCIWLRSLKNGYKASCNQLLFTARKNLERSRQRKKNVIFSGNCVTTIKSLSTSFRTILVILLNAFNLIVKKKYNSSRSRVRNYVINCALHVLDNNVERIECSLFLRRFRAHVLNGCHFLNGTLQCHCHCLQSTLQNTEVLSYKIAAFLASYWNLLKREIINVNT